MRTHSRHLWIGSAPVPSPTLRGGLALMIVAGLMIFGSQRAPEHVFRIAGGIMLILVVIPAVLA